MVGQRYLNGEYLRRHPSWHAEDAGWKAKQIIRLLERNGVEPKSVCEVGCGSGEILRQMQATMDEDCVFWGYDISPQAIELSASKANERLHFKNKDVNDEEAVHFDLLLIIDLIEHLEDYFGFLRKTRSKAEFKVIHVPLELSVQTVFRKGWLLKNRTEFGHLHYFTKETALQSLRDIDYEVVDWFYTPSGIELSPRTLMNRLARLPRRLSFSINEDWTVRVLGGFSLLVLAR